MQIFAHSDKPTNELPTRATCHPECSTSCFGVNFWPSGSMKTKVISEALGHASVAFTLDTYSHIIEGMQEDAMALLDEVIPPAKNNGNLTVKVNIKLNKNNN